ncbi:MAG: alpha-glucosidase family protein, partial [Coleofasciculaceae cyanobacterium]
ERTQLENWWREPVLNRRAWIWEDANNLQRNGEWWQHAVIYQISPQSFKDSDGNGSGDLDGIIEKLDYIVSLGVDAIWLCPIYESPMDDFGYDITDMRDIDPLFGDLEDFQQLIDVSHTMGLKVLIDQVWSHTSDKHPWFLESRQSQSNSKADWYVWADPKPDGSPPNNWLSAFMGHSAWQWGPERKQFYMYNFLSSQPDLNWHNPEVVEAILERAKFWLELGVDGFRIDAPNFFLHDHELRDNPPRPEDAPQPDGVSPNNPIVRQMFKYNFCRPETLEALLPIRQLMNQYPGTVTLGEVTFCDDSIALASEYATGDKRLHMAYHSALLVDQPMSATLMRRIMEKMKTHFTQGGDCWIVGNHDYGRLRSRWTGKDVKGNPYPEEFYHLMAALLLCLPGAFCLYQGDELGLTEARIPEDIPVEEIKDPFGKALYPAIKGRDVSRTPMPWHADKLNAGFTTAEKPWLPVPEAHYAKAVNIQNQDPQSLLNTWRRLLHWRKKQPALEAGDFEILDAQEPIFAFIRQYAEQRLLCVFNLSNESVNYDLSTYPNFQETKGLGFTTYLKENNLELPGYSVFFGNLPSGAVDNFPVNGASTQAKSDPVPTSQSRS